MDLSRFAAPMIGSSVQIDVMEGLVIGQLLEDSSSEPEALIDGVMNDVTGSGRSLMREGRKLEDPAEARHMIGDTVRGLLERRLGLLRGLGVID
jgi:hypothetical protein